MTIRVDPYLFEAVKIGAGGTRAVFTGYVGGVARRQRELFSAPLDGSASPVRMSGATVAFADVLTDYEPGFLTNFDGSRVVFVADRSTDGVYELYSCDGAGPVRPRDVHRGVAAPASTRARRAACRSIRRNHRRDRAGIRVT